MLGIDALWSGLTEPQATLIASLITVLGAIGAVVFGSMLFAGRVTDLKSALDESGALVADHKERVEGLLSEIRKEFSVAMESLGQLRGEVGDLQISSAAEEPVAQAEARARLKDDWNALRDELERIAANPAIDGRTRGRYSRIDRRRYIDLIDALGADHRLGANTEAYRSAVGIWHRYRNGRQRPTRAHLDEMRHIREALLPDPVPDAP